MAIPYTIEDASVGHSVTERRVYQHAEKIDEDLFRRGGGSPTVAQLILEKLLERPAVAVHVTWMYLFLPRSLMGAWCYMGLNFQFAICYLQFQKRGPSVLWVVAPSWSSCFIKAYAHVRDQGLNLGCRVYN